MCQGSTIFYSENTEKKFYHNSAWGAKVVEAAEVESQEQSDKMFSYNSKWTTDTEYQWHSNSVN